MIISIIAIIFHLILLLVQMYLIHKTQEKFWIVWNTSFAWFNFIQIVVHGLKLAAQCG